MEEYKLLKMDIDISENLQKNFQKQYEKTQTRMMRIIEHGKQKDIFRSGKKAVYELFKVYCQKVDFKIYETCTEDEKQCVLSRLDLQFEFLRSINDIEKSHEYEHGANLLNSFVGMFPEIFKKEKKAEE